MKLSTLRRLTALLLAVVLTASLSACTISGSDFTSGIDNLFGNQSDDWFDQFFGNSSNGGNVSSPFDFAEPEADDMLTLKQLQAQLNETRKNDTRTNLANAERFLPKGYDTEEFKQYEFTDAELKRLTAEGRGSSRITLSQAQEDIDLLFRLFKTSYAPYEYFGGDEVFDKAKQDILTEVNLAAASDGIASYRMASIITKRLDFLHDSHLMIGYNKPTFEEEIYYYDAAKSEFRRDTKGYYVKLNGEKLYLAAEDEDYMYLTIGSSGELVYGLIKLCGENSVYALKKSFELSGEFGTKYTLVPRWTSDGYTYAMGGLTWNKNVNGIPLTGIGSMSVDNDDAIAEMNTFVNNAKTLSGTDVAMLDLRGNMGGLSTISIMWLYNLTGKEIEGEYSMVYYNSVLNDHVSTGNEEVLIAALLKFDFFNEHPDLKEELLEETTDELYAGTVYETEDVWVPRDGTLFVLSDKAVSSAGEMFLLQAKDIENTVIVGTNSNGCLISGGTNYDVPVYLPNSGLWIYYSTALILTDEPGDFDTAGIQPDIVVCGEDSARAAARCWEFYKTHTN